MKIKIILLIGVLFMSMACEQYDEYLVDYKFSAVYFASQKPLRTIVSYDQMEFKVGVALGGKRSNDTNEYADFEIDPSLLDDDELVEGNSFELMPSEYYSFSNDSKMEISKGDFIGDITVTLNKNVFTADDLSKENTYAIPLRITSTSTDSILEGKNYTILVVKYISQYDGTYYHKGTQTEVDENDVVIEETVYSTKNLIDNEKWDVSTVGATSISTPGAGTFGNGNLILNVNESDNTVAITSGNGNVVITEQSGTYNNEKREFYIDYNFTRSSKMYKVSDTLVLRQAPEKDLYFEEW